MSDEHQFRITKDEIIRIRNRGCGNDWPKVWNVQLNELCDAYEVARELTRAAALRDAKRYIWPIKNPERLAAIDAAISAEKSNPPA